MKTKTAPAMTILAHRVKTSMKTLLTDVGDLPQEIFKNAVQNGLHPAGPQYWIYEWSDEKMDENATFDLTISLPVATFGVTYKSSKFELRKLEPFKNIAAEHLGPWDNLKETYGKLMGEIEKQKLTAGLTCREIYINCDFENPANNITEVQFEIN